MQGKLLILRKERGVTQQKMADLLGVTKETYRRKEKGLTVFGSSEMFKIANFFDKDIGEIFLK
ncbi:TPA: helix-turn-helix transcriptional regulator [Streptococcus agalactiae]